VEGQTIDAGGGGVILGQATRIRGENATITASGSVSMKTERGGPRRIDINGSRIESTGGSSISILEASDISARNSDIDSNGGGISMKADKGDGPIDAAGTQFSSAGGDITLNANTNNGDVFIDDTTTQEAIVDAGSGSASAKLNGTLYFDGVVIDDDDDELTLTGSGNKASGDSTESGSVS